MRGVISAGMVWALEDLGYLPAFDAVYGSSAGAINAAYFLAGQAGLGTSIYFEDINTATFISLARALTSRPILNLSFLLDDVARHRKALAVDRVLASQAPLTVLATSVESRTAEPLGPFVDAADLFGALRAGATMPIVAGGPTRHRGREYLDASLSEPIPLLTAERRQHTHVLVLLTRSAAMRARPSALDRYFVGPRLRRLSPDLARQYLGRAAPYSALIQAIDAGRGPLGQADVVGLRAPGLTISRLERRADVLRNGAREGYEAVVRWLGDDRSPPP